MHRSTTRPSAPPRALRAVRDDDPDPRAAAAEAGSGRRQRPRDHPAGPVAAGDFVVGLTPTGESNDLGIGVVSDELGPVLQVRFPALARPVFWLRRELRPAAGPDWTPLRARDLLAQGSPVARVAAVSGYDLDWLQNEADRLLGRRALSAASG